MLVALAAPATAAGSAARGEYIFYAAGCKTCHTDKKAGGSLLAGGAALETPFGVFYAPNITPDPDFGVGRWTEDDFIRALAEGVAPDGSDYYPAFPYTSYTGMTRGDAADLWAYIRTLPPASTASRPHELDFPFSWRFLVGFWKWLYFTPGPMAADPARDGTWNRGAYLVRVLGHCAECHSPRNALGSLDEDSYLAGNPDGPDGEPVPNITPDAKTGIGDWSTGDITFALGIGILPNSEVIGSAMADVVQETTGKLTDADLAAIAVYLQSLLPISNVIARKPKDGD